MLVLVFLCTYSKKRLSLIAYFSMQVIWARRKYNISPPNTSGHPTFERVFRAQWVTIVLYALYMWISCNFVKYKNLNYLGDYLTLSHPHHFAWNTFLKSSEFFMKQLWKKVCFGWFFTYAWFALLVKHPLFFYLSMFLPKVFRRFPPIFN